jgi:hypothetical protein
MVAVPDRYPREAEALLRSPARVSPSQAGEQRRGSLTLHVHVLRGRSDGSSRERWIWGGVRDVLVPRSAGSQASQRLIGNLEGRLAMQRGDAFGSRQADSWSARGMVGGPAREQGGQQLRQGLQVVDGRTSETARRTASTSTECVDGRSGGVNAGGRGDAGRELGRGAARARRAAGDGKTGERKPAQRDGGDGETRRWRDGEVDRRRW